MIIQRKQLFGNSESWGGKQSRWSDGTCGASLSWTSSWLANCLCYYGTRSMLNLRVGNYAFLEWLVRMDRAYNPNSDL